MSSHTHTHPSLFPELSPGGRVALKRCEPSYDSPGHPGVCGLARLSQPEKALFVWALSTRRTPLIPMTPPPPPPRVRVLPHLQDTPQLQMWELGETKAVWMDGGCWGEMQGCRRCGRGSSRWAGAAPLSTNGIIVCTPQVLTIQMRSQLKCGSSEVEQGRNFSAEKQQMGNKHT